MGQKAEFELLQSFVQALGPSGQEDEVRFLCHMHLKPLVDDIWVDPAGNLIGRIYGKNKEPQHAIRLMMHMDEISLIIKRIFEDGSLRVDPLGGILPYTFGQGPVDILGDKEKCSGILSFGCIHTTKESSAQHKMLPDYLKGQGKTPEWEDVKVITRKSPEELHKLGVHIGSRVVISQTRRKLHFFQDCVAGYFFDNRSALVVSLLALQQIRKAKKRPYGDLYFVATPSEEVDAHGASYAARTLPGDISLAIDVAPVAKEYQTVLTSSPVIVYKDSIAVYDKAISDTLMHLGNKLKFSPQCAVFGNYGSDASLAQQRGQSARSALMCIPVENTHGYEIAHIDSFTNCANLLSAYLLNPNEK